MYYDQKVLDEIHSRAMPLKGSSSDYDVLLALIDDAQIVLLGEATHGTHEFYDIRAQVSKRLITEKGFHAVAIEGDWPDAYQINRYIHQQKYSEASQAFASFDRFPTWMWRNVPMIQLANWLRDYNQEQPSEKKVNFYGLDLYSLYRSIDAVIACLKKIDPAAAAQAEYHYSCLDHYRHDPQAYGYAVISSAIQSCEGMVIEQLKYLQKYDWQYLEHNAVSASEAFYIEQNARVVKNAEHYYRSLFVSDTSSWNVRDSHMLETLNALIAHYQSKGIERPKIIIWAHNSHIGNAAATQMSEHGEYNIGQLVKEQFGTKAVSVGFTTYEGTVSAASNWHAPVERKSVLKALPDSYEALFHAIQIPNFLLVLENMSIIPHKLLERAIGVVYRPETERTSHYFYADLVEQFDAIIHCDQTSAVEPLEKTSEWIAGETPETYPSGL
jgi:erythromycin esterase-like protein